MESLLPPSHTAHLHDLLAAVGNVGPVEVLLPHLVRNVPQLRRVVWRRRVLSVSARQVVHWWHAEQGRGVVAGPQVQRQQVLQLRVVYLHPLREQVPFCMQKKQPIFKTDRNLLSALRAGSHRFFPKCQAAGLTEVAETQQRLLRCDAHEHGHGRHRPIHHQVFGVVGQEHFLAVVGLALALALALHPALRRRRERQEIDAVVARRRRGAHLLVAPHQLVHRGAAQHRLHVLRVVEADAICGTRAC